MAYSYVLLISLQILAFVSIHASGDIKEDFNGDQLMELAVNVWNLDEHAKAMFHTQICKIANGKEADGQMTTELEQIKTDLSEYCGAHKNTQEKREKLEKMQKNVKKLLGSGDWAKNIKKSLESAQKEFEANKNDGKVKMALKQEEEILNKIKQKMPSEGMNIPEWFRSGLNNALHLDQNGEISIKGLFGLMDTIFDKFFVDKNGFANQILAGTQGQGKGHHHHHQNRASAHVPLYPHSRHGELEREFGALRVKRDDELPGFIPGVGGTLILLAIVVVFAPILFPLLVICFVIGGILMAIMGGD